MNSVNRDRMLKKYAVSNRGSKSQTPQVESKLSKSLARNKSIMNNKSSPNLDKAATLRSMQLRQSAPTAPLVPAPAVKTPKSVANILKPGISVPPKISTGVSIVPKKPNVPSVSVPAKQDAQKTLDVNRKTKAPKLFKNIFEKKPNKAPLLPANNADSNSKRNLSSPARMKVKLSASLAREMFVKQIQNRRRERSQHMEALLNAQSTHVPQPRAAGQRKLSFVLKDPALKAEGKVKDVKKDRQQPGAKLGNGLNIKSKKTVMNLLSGGAKSTKTIVNYKQTKREFPKSPVNNQNVRGAASKIPRKSESK